MLHFCKDIILLDVVPRIIITVSSLIHITYTNCITLIAAVLPPPPPNDERLFKSAMAVATTNAPHSSSSLCQDAPLSVHWSKQHEGHSGELSGRTAR